MNFVIDSKYFFQNLKAISSVLSKSNNINILTCFILNLTNGFLKIKASDLYLCIKITLKVVSKRNGKAAVPAKLLLEILKQLPEQPIKIKKINYNQLRISCLKGNYELCVLDHKLFPKHKKIKNPKYCMLKKDTILNIINNTLFAVGNEELRPVLNGVCFNIKKQKGSFVATNAKILAKYFLNNLKNKEKIQFILPKKTLLILKQIFLNNLKNKEQNKYIKIQYNKYNTWFKVSNKVLISSLIKGDVPNYDSIIPKAKIKNKLIINVQYLLKAIKRITLFSNPKDNRITFSFSLKQNIIFSENNELTNKGLEELICEYSGENLEISFNSKDLLEGLSNLTCKDIEIKFQDKYTPAIIQPIFSLKQEKILRIIIPLT
ncbi:DNA polymerase III subunit beta [Candidatus Karelsulcia muelleri]|uniref:Beta sliding clamp n=1 Tax=Candidatus Karelsulcia muelleri TaxID=336810 RepID=A0A346E0W8_9FLAO|nr:DNA polymerase III subunit beta [Candidatus Karelsulcia muelleri]AXN02623.1 DNA polymerase III beta subunit [Candidatus Karelsulcia muelleri]WDI79560.1 DNA polymerase III subunit beta [Candidatus Karelsulcia muelleri]WDR79018.1 DNA polymerase III subunit beta [Candidatus Karelsulcia muelleri]